jgi:hypothetical protein
MPSGPVSFMQVWDAMCGTILSTGARRGAMMATLRCDHPDIDAFIAAKQQAGQLRHARSRLRRMRTDILAARPCWSSPAAPRASMSHDPAIGGAVDNPAVLG